MLALSAAPPLLALMKPAAMGETALWRDPGDKDQREDNSGMTAHQGLRSQPNSRSCRPRGMSLGEVPGSCPRRMGVTAALAQCNLGDTPSH